MFQRLPSAYSIRSMILYSLFGLKRDSDFFHFSFSQHIQYDLCTEFEGVTEGLTVSQHVDFPLGGHEFFKQLQLLIVKRFVQGIVGLNDFVQCPGILAAALEAALAGMNVSQVKIF